jgi:hypothetical protein
VQTVRRGQHRHLRRRKDSASAHHHRRLSEHRGRKHRLRYRTHRNWRSPVEMAVEGSSLCAVDLLAATGRRRPRSGSGTKQVRQCSLYVMASLVASVKGFWMGSGTVSQTLRSDHLSLRRHSVALTDSASVLVWCRCQRSHG